MGRTLLPLPPCSPDLAPSDFHLFGPSKDAFRGHRFAGDDDDDLKCGGREVLLRFTKELRDRHATSHSALETGAAFGVASGATAPGPALEWAPRFRPMSLSSYILR